MAVSFKTDISYGYNLLQMFGVNPNYISAATANGVTIEQSSPGTFMVKGADGKLGGVVSIKGQAISLAKSGQLGPASKQSIQFQFEGALKALLGDVSATPAKALHKPESSVPLSTLFSEEEAKVAQKKWMDPPPLVSEIINKPKGAAVKLENATALYQSVLGTSSGSIYKVIALLKGASMAVRIKGNTVSFRVEGPSLNFHKSALATAGFTVKDSYASVHFDIPDLGLRKKTLGAICGAIGFANVIEVGAFEEVK